MLCFRSINVFEKIVFFMTGLKKIFVSIKVSYPNIAQLVERPTVERLWLSGGPWFESGCSDGFYIFFIIYNILQN